MLTKGLMGIDIGGTNIKAVVCDQQGTILSLASEPALRCYGGGKIDTESQRNLISENLWYVTKSVIKTALGRLPEACRVCSIAVSSVGCTILAFDPGDKQIDICADSQTLEKEYERLTAAYGEREFQELTGYPRERGLSGLHLTGCGRCNPQIAKICFVDDFIVYKLTGIESRNYSTAASSGMWDTKQGAWIEFLKQGTELTDQILGDPVYGGTLVGNVSKKASDETGLSTGIRVSTGGMDYQCAAFSIQNLIGDNLFNITGTIDLMACYGERPHGHRGDVRYLQDYHVMPAERNLMMECAGAANLEWLRQEILAQDGDGAWPDWDSLFQGLKGNYENQWFHRELFIPQIYGASIPSLDGGATGVLGGLNKNTDRGMLLRAMLEGMAYEVKYMADYLSHGDRDKKLILVGGGSRNETWVQLKADILGRDVIVPGIREASAVGAALLGAVGAGIYSDYNEARDALKLPPESRIIHNRRRSEYYEAFFEEIYLPFVEQWEETNRKITRMNERYGKME